LAVAVDDPHDVRLADYLDLPRRSRSGVLIAEGRLVVRKLLTTPRVRPRSVVATASALAALSDVLSPSTPTFIVRAELARALVGYDFHRGCLAAGEPPAALPPAELTAPPARLVLALERVSGPDNLGVVFRNAAAFGADGVLLSPGSGDPLYRRAIRTSMGATFVVPFAHAPDWPAELVRLRAAGFTLVALTPGPEAGDLAALRTRPARVALLVGSEGTGLDEATRAAADLCVRIPMAPGVDSLNVATACGIALHHLRAIG
jgi:tRNA G18 (ribose-2'-O)-methylase SpoU